MFSRALFSFVCVAYFTGFSSTAFGQFQSQKSKQKALQQQQQAQTPLPPPKLPRIQDDFAELDDTVATRSVSAGTSDRFIAVTLETSRQQYLRALSFINKGDTVRAAKSFEASIQTLNKLSDFPRIEENGDFTDLMQSIIDDYETYIQSIDNLGENSPFFVLRDKFFQEIDKDSPLYGELSFTRDRQKSGRQNVVQLKLPESSSELGKIVGMKGVNLQIPMTDNPLTQKSFEFFVSERGRRYFQKFLERAGRWFPMMRRIAREEGAPEEIIYLAITESALLPTAVSRAQAVGLWQFIKSTGQMYGLNVDYWVDERRDPEKSTRAAMRHLKDLYNEFGDWHLAMAAYNCGVGGVRRAIARSGLSNPDYWDIRDKLPRETRGYVPMYIAMARAAMNPEMNGFVNIPLEEPYQYDTVLVRESLDFKVLARCAGVSEAALEELNPELVRSATPGGDYWLKLPLGTKNTFTANYKNLGDEDRQTWITHTVSGRETLYSIARQYKVSPTALASANGLTGKKKRISQGMVLKIPQDALIPDEAADVELAANPSSGKSKSRLEEYDERQREYRERKEQREQREQREKEAREQRERERLEREESAKLARSENRTETRADVRTDSRAEKEKTESRGEAIITATQPANTKKLTHQVAKGETLYSIANRYGVRLADLRNWNNIGYNTDNLGIDDQLTVYVPKSFREQESTKSAEATAIVVHKVKQGETLAKIADDYNVSIQDIRKTSGLRGRERIFIGQALKIPVSSAMAAKLEKTDREQPKQPQPDIVQSAKEPSASKPSLGGITMHSVKKGETPAAIARQYGVNLADLLKWNPNAQDGQLSIGEELKIYTQNTAKGSSANEGKTSLKSYSVRQGDTAFSIAKKFGITLQQLLKLNPGMRENNLSVGQRLRVAE
jgi:membrane-bound lytic murein transglycosylase D